jgi:hypothetical protein
MFGRIINLEILDSNNGGCMDSACGFYPLSEFLGRFGNWSAYLYFSGIILFCAEINSEHPINRGLL